MKGFWLLPLVEVNYPANGPMFQINGSSWYFVKVTGIRSLIPTGMVCLMPDSFLLHTTRRRSGPARPYARKGRAHSFAPPLLVGSAPSVSAGSARASRPKASPCPPLRRRPSPAARYQVFSASSQAAFRAESPRSTGTRRARNHCPRLRFGFAGAPRVARPLASENPQVKAMLFFDLLERCHQNRTVNGGTRDGCPPGGRRRQKRARVRSRASFGRRR